MKNKERNGKIGERERGGEWEREKERKRGDKRDIASDWSSKGS